MKYFALFLTVLSLLFLIPIAESVIITEIMYDPPLDLCKDDFCEWLEIYNPSEDEVDLTGWKLCDKNLLPGFVDHSDEQVYEDSGLILLPFQFAVITDGGSGTEVYAYFDVDLTSLAIHVDASSLCGRLKNTNHTVVISNSEGNIVDSVFYSSSIGANGNGDSLQKSDSMWLSCSPTPGFENCLLEVTTTTTTLPPETTTTVLDQTTTTTTTIIPTTIITETTTTTPQETTTTTTTTQKPTTTTQQITTTIKEEPQLITGKAVSFWDRVLNFFRSLFPWLRR